MDSVKQTDEHAGGAMDRNIIPPMGGLSVTATGGLTGAVRSWFQRRRVRAINLEIDADALEMSGLSSEEQGRLIEVFLKHLGQGAKASPVGNQPEPQDQVPDTDKAGSVGEAEEAERTESLTDEERAELRRNRAEVAELRVRAPQAPGEAIGVSIREVDSSIQGVSTEQVVKFGDDYASRLLKYIPTETVAAYLALSGVVASANGQNRAAMLWAVFAFGLLLTPLYLRRVGRVRSWLQLVISTAAFVVWVFALGGPWALLSWYEPYYGTLLLIAFTTTAPLVIPVPPGLKPAFAS
jgi:hypothetical protein